MSIPNNGILTEVYLKVYMSLSNTNNVTAYYYVSTLNNKRKIPYFKLVTEKEYNDVIENIKYYFTTKA